MEKKLSLAKNATYNTVGTVIFCLCQWATTLVVVRLLDSYDSAGIFQLAISITNIFFAISTFSMRTYQISDVRGDYSQGEYIGMRIVTCTLALVLCTAYSIILAYPVRTVACIVAYMIFKFNESFSDVLHGIDQRHYRMDFVGISYIIRGIVMILSFSLSLLCTRDVLISTVVMAFSTCAVVVVYDANKTKKLESIRPEFNFGKIIKMMLKCLPVVIASATFTAVTTVPRQFLESAYSESILGYYATVATPVVFVQVLSTSIFNPLLCDLAEYYNKREDKKFVLAILKTVAFLLGIGVLAFAGAYLLGEFAYTLIYGEEIREYCYLMYAVLACSLAYSVCWLVTNVLIIMRRLVSSMTASIVALAVAVAISKPMIESFYLNGVSFTVLIAYAVFALFGIAIAVYDFIKRRE